MFGKSKKEKKEGKAEKKNTASPAPQPGSGTVDPVPGQPAPPPEPSKTPTPTGVAPVVSKEDEERRKKEKEEAEKRQKEEEEKRKREEERQREERARQEAEKQKEKERKEQEKRKNKEKRKEEEKRTEEDEGAEIKELESVKPGPNDSKTTYKDLYDFFPSEIFTAYDRLQSFSRDLNTPILTPEVILVGPQGHGKSTILEAIIGQQLTAVGYQGATQRPLHLNILNNIDCAKPRVTIKRDSLLPEFDHDLVVPLNELPNEIDKRNKVFSPEPIFVQYEHKDTLNITFIDTPGLVREDQGDITKAKLDKMILNMVKIPTRLIIRVEEAKEWDHVENIDFLKQVDPEMARTIFVYTKFYTHLQRFTSTRQVNKYLSGVMPDTKTFFTTILSSKVRRMYSDPDKFQEKIWQAQRRDLAALEQLQFDKKFEANIGVHALRRYLLNMTWKGYQEGVPRILKRLRTKKSHTEDLLRKSQEQLLGLDSSRLRTIASSYVVEFLQIIERLLAGTSEGNPLVNGQTLEDEKTQCSDGDWVDAQNRVLKLDPEATKIPYWDSKLYGGQQFERLLAEFKAVAESMKCTEPTTDDIATAAGINKINNIPNYAWAACDLATQRTEESFIPLIEKVCNRGTYTMKRLTDIAECIMEQRRKQQWTNDSTVDIDKIEQYPYFTFHVKDLYNKFVENTAKICQEKCMDEFYNTRTIYWDLTETMDPKTSIPVDRDAEAKKAVVDLTVSLFKSLQERITRHSLLKFYNFFLVPLQTELWSVVQGSITSLSDSALEQIFEVSATKNKIKEDEKLLQQIIQQCTEQEYSLLESSNNFSHKIVVSGITKE